MFLHELSIRNYKSLRDITFSPAPISAVIGPNAAGKSNLASAVHFLSEVYELGLEPAIARKGGYENIAFRHKRRSKVLLSFEIALDFGSGELRHYDLPNDRPAKFIHQFSILASGTGIGASFKILEENFRILGASEDRNGRDPITYSEFLRVGRDSERNISVVRNKKGEWTREFIGFEGVSKSQYWGEQDLFLKSFSRWPFQAFSHIVSGYKTYQFLPVHSRLPGVPTPNPSLAQSGRKLTEIDPTLEESWENGEFQLADFLDSGAIGQAVPGGVW